MQQRMSYLATETQTFMTKVYGWMSLGLIVTGLIAVFTVFNPIILRIVILNDFVFYGLLLAEFGLVIYLTARIQHMSATMAVSMFLLYAAINGLTLSLIFLIFTAGSIATTFFITAGMFGIMSAYGYVTKQDLTTVGNIAMMALVGIILASIVNIFWYNDMLYWITTYVGILVFVALTAYDTQKIKRMNILGNAGTDEDKKEAIMGALTLYLDFINLFLKLLRIFGKKR